MGTAYARESTDVLIGKPLEDARKYIEIHEVFFGNLEFPITEIHVCRKDGKPQSGIKDIRSSDGRMRLNVWTKNDVIIKIDHVG
jgi:hypothetical protein